MSAHSYSNICQILIKFSLILIIPFMFYQASSQTGNSNLDEMNLTDMIIDSSGTLYLGTEYNGIYQSTDNGMTWRLTSNISKDYFVKTLIYDEYEGLIAATNNGAILQSTDEGKTWRVRRAYNYNSFGEISHMIITKENYKIFTLTNECNMSLDNNNIAVIFAYQDDIIYPYLHYLFFDDDDILYTCGSVILRNDFYGSKKWVDIRNGLNLFSYCLTGDRKGRIFIGTTAGIYFSDNKGDNWTLLSEDIEDLKVNSMLLTKNGNFIISTDSVGISLSSNNGLSWELVPLDIPNLNINRFFENNNSLFALTQKKGLLVSFDNGRNWSKTGEIIENQADSSFASGWMPSVNFYDVFINKGRINFVQFFHNDSLIAVNDNNDYLIYSTQTGQFVRTISYPFYVDYINFKGDSIIVSYDNSASVFIDIYRYDDNSRISSLIINKDHFRSQSSLKLSSINFYYIYFDDINGQVYLYYNLHLMDYRSYEFDEIFFETRYINSFYEVNYIKKGVHSFSKSCKYHLHNHFTLNDNNNKQVYNLSTIPENKAVLKDSKVVKSAISPNNHFIILYDYENRNYLIFDFQSGKFLRKIESSWEYESFRGTADDTYLIAASDESAVKIYNLYNSGKEFDKVIFWPGDSRWVFSVAESSNMVVFAGTDATLRLWKPNISLTSVEDAKIHQIASDDITIAPNPASDYIEINLGNIILSEAKDLKIYNSLGQCVLLDVPHFESVAHLYRIDISGLSPGMYYAVLSDGKKILTNGFIVLR